MSQVHLCHCHASIIRSSPVKSGLSTPISYFILHNVGDKSGVEDDLVTPKKFVNCANQKQKKPGSFTPATPLVLSHREHKPASSVSSEAPPSTVDENYYTSLVNHMNDTREALFIDQCLIRSLCLEIQSQQRDIQGFLSSLYGEPTYIKKGMEQLHAKMNEGLVSSERTEHTFNRRFIELKQDIVAMDSLVLENHKYIQETSLKQCDLYEDLPKDISACHAKLDDLQIKINHISSHDSKTKEDTPVLKPSKSIPDEVLVEEITRGISSLPTGIKRDIPPRAKSSSHQTPSVQKEEAKPAPSEIREGISLPQYLKSIDDRVQRSGDRKTYPKNSEYPTFEGKPDEDWTEFIDIIDTLQASYSLPDSEITSRLPSILLGVARVWYRVKCKTNKGASWEDWKNFDERNFNTSTWRISQLSLRDKETFSYANSDTLFCLLQLQKRVQAVYSEGDIEDQKTRIIMRFPCEVKTAINTLARGVDDISEFLSVCEAVINNSWGKVNATKNITPRDHQASRRISENEEPVTVPWYGIYNDQQPKEKRLCYKCKGPWSGNHKCKGVQINLVEEEEDDKSEIGLPSDED